MSLVERFREELEEHRHPRTYVWVHKLLAQVEEDAELVQEAVHNGAMAELIALSKLMEDILMTDVVVKQEDLDALGGKLEAAAVALAGEINTLLQQAAAVGVTLPAANLQTINTALNDLTALETPAPVTPPATTPPATTPPATTPPVTDPGTPAPAASGTSVPGSNTGAGPDASGTSAAPTPPAPPVPTPPDPGTTSGGAVPGAGTPATDAPPAADAGSATTPPVIP